MATQKQNTVRAKSNVRAACKRLGIAGVLGILESCMLQSAVNFLAGSEKNDHYTRLAMILESAQKNFRKECNRFDNGESLPDPASVQYNVWLRSSEGHENHFVALLTPGQATELETLLRDRTRKDKDVSDYVVVRNENLSFEQVSKQVLEWLDEVA